MEQGVKRILLAEDNPADVYLLREALNEQRIPYHLTVVTDGEQAQLAIEEAQGDSLPDLIVLDLNLPKSDGGDVLRKIRERPELSNAPVIVLTSSDSPRDRSAIAALGASCYITKPSDLDAFMELGKTLMDFAHGRGSSTLTTGA